MGAFFVFRVLWNARHMAVVVQNLDKIPTRCWGSIS